MFQFFVIADFDTLANLQHKTIEKRPYLGMCMHRNTNMYLTRKNKIKNQPIDKTLFFIFIFMLSKVEKIAGVILNQGQIWH